jgi:tetratricopeptide (TPR) repeat protein
MAETRERSAVDSQAGTVYSEADKARARTFFKRAEQAAASRNYDYAFELYVNGLTCWPEAVEEGHQKLRLVGVQRRTAGGKKPGMVEAVKMPMTGKDPLKAMLNAEVLLAKDPGNLGYMEGVLKNARKLGLTDTIMWLVTFMFDEVLAEKKVHPSRYFLIRDALAEVAERCEASGDLQTAIAAMQRACNVMETLFRHRPHDLEVSNTLRDTSSRLTILKGKYGSGESFRDSIRDADSQKQVYEQDRLVQSKDKLTQLIEQATEALEKEPNDPHKIHNLVDLLTQKEDMARENQAVKLLEEAYRRLDNYRFKHRADDIRLRQLKRRQRELQQSDDQPALAEFRRKRTEFELAVFKERVEVYPTDLRFKYQYGERLFAARMFDEAIPVLQEAKADPKSRLQCAILLGRCFLEKEYVEPAIDTFREGIEAHEIKGDEISKELHYWLGRALEVDDRPQEAVKNYGLLIQWDFNYREARKRMDALKKK